MDSFVWMKVWFEIPNPALPQVLLPEMAQLRIAVFDEDKEMIGTRVLPLNAIRPGFRHINLRDKHNGLLPLELLLVHIKVEDWVPDEMEGENTG